MPSNRKVSFPATTSPALAVGDCAPRCSDPGPSVARAVATWKDAGRHGRRAGCAELSLGSPSFSLTSRFISQDKSHGHSWRPGARAEQSLPPTARRTHRGNGTDDGHTLRRWAIFLRPFQVSSVLLQRRLRGVGGRAVVPSSLPARPWRSAQVARGLLCT